MLSKERDKFSSQVVRVWLRQRRRSVCYSHWTTPEIIIEFNNSCTPITRKYMKSHLWRMKCLNSLGSWVPKSHSTPSDLYNWASFKLGVTIILRPSKQTFRSRIFRFKLPSCQSDNYLNYLVGPQHAFFKFATVSGLSDITFLKD
jgi:hypothetical protein